MRNGSKKRIPLEELNRRFKVLSESDEDLFTKDSLKLGYSHCLEVVGKYKDVILKNIHNGVSFE